MSLTNILHLVSHHILDQSSMQWIRKEIGSLPQHTHSQPTHTHAHIHKSVDKNVVLEMHILSEEQTIHECILDWNEEGQQRRMIS